MPDENAITEAMKRELEAVEARGHAKRAEHIRELLAERGVQTTSGRRLEVADFHIGGGWYEINGQTVRGRDAAEALLK